MKYRIFVYAVVMFIIIFLFLSGCSPTMPVPTPDDDRPVATQIPASRSPATPTPLPATQTPSATPDPTPTITISPVPASATPHLIPAPPGDEATEQVLWLFETNNGCQLPCWWGITPGQTEWSVAEEFLNTFIPSVYRPLSTPEPTSELVGYEPVIPLPTTVFAEDHMNLGIAVHNGVVEMIQTDVSIGDTPPGYLNRYTLPVFLTTYGQPAEIWLSTYPSAQGQNDLPFRVILFYPDQGITALFSDNGVRQEDVVRGCPQQDPVRFLKLWSPTLRLTFEEVRSSTSAFNVDFLPLQETTGISITTFYETFKDPENITCLETPAALW